MARLRQAASRIPAAWRRSLPQLNAQSSSAESRSEPEQAEHDRAIAAQAVKAYKGILKARKAREFADAHAIAAMVRTERNGGPRASNFSAMIRSAREDPSATISSSPLSEQGQPRKRKAQTSEPRTTPSKKTRMSTTSSESEVIFSDQPESSERDSVEDSERSSISTPTAAEAIRDEPKNGARSTSMARQLAMHGGEEAAMHSEPRAADVGYDSLLIHCPDSATQTDFDQDDFEGEEKGSDGECVVADCERRDEIRDDISQTSAVPGHESADFRVSHHDDETGAHLDSEHHRRSSVLAHPQVQIRHLSLERRAMKDAPEKEGGRDEEPSTKPSTSSRKIPGQRRGGPATRTNSGKFWPIISIELETETKYYVNWEGLYKKGKRKGKRYGRSWVRKSHVTDAAIRDWEAKKGKKVNQRRTM